MREMDLDMMHLVVSVPRVLRRQIEIAADDRGATISELVREALENAFGAIELSEEDWRLLAADVHEAWLKRLEIREDRKRGVKRPNGRPPGTQLPGGRRKRPAPEAARQGTEDAEPKAAPEAARHGTAARNRKRR